MNDFLLKKVMFDVRWTPPEISLYIYLFMHDKTRFSSVSVAIILRTGQLWIMGSIQIGRRGFIIPLRVPIGSSVHRASYTMGTGFLSLEVQQPEHETEHSPSCSKEGNNVWIYTSIPPYLFLAWCLIT
jgi:hypothetical protein